MSYLIYVPVLPWEEQSPDRAAVKHWATHQGKHSQLQLKQAGEVWVFIQIPSSSPFLCCRAIPQAGLEAVSFATLFPGAKEFYLLYLMPMLILPFAVEIPTSSFRVI